MDIYDLLSGKKIGSAESASAIAGTRADSGIITAVTENGDRMLIDISVPEYWRSSRLFVSSLKSATIAPSGVWVLQNNSEDIVCYSTVASDPLWSEYNISMLSEQGTGLYQIDTLVQDGIAAFLYVNMQGRYSVILGDGSPSSSLREVILQDKLYGEPMTSYTIEDFYDGKLFLSWETDSRWGYMDIDLSTLKTETSYPEKYAEAIFSGYAGKGRFCIVYPEDMPGYDENKYHLCILNSAAETVNSTFLGRYSPGCSISCTFDPQGMIYAVIPQANTVKKIDPMIGTRLDVPVGFADMLLDLSDRDLNFSSDIAWSDDSSFTASMISPTQIRVSDSEGNRLFTVDEDVLRIGFFTFTSDNRFLLVMGSDDRLRRYDVRTGDLAGSLKLYAESYSGMYEYSFPENRDFMTVLVGDTLNLVSLSDWEIFGYVGDCIGYQRTNDLFVCYKEDSDISYGCFPRYSVQMLLDHGQELLGGWDLSHEQRTAFGVGDPD